ncbi:MAG: hypothetical protein ACETVQ_04215, partial [Candidatus Bathyarchaeia archaeon]
THYVKCLFCEDKFVCEDPKSKTTVNQCIKEIDDDLRRLKEHPDLKTRTRLRKDGEKLKERIKKFGSTPASHLFCIGQK